MKIKILKIAFVFGLLLFAGGVSAQYYSPYSNLGAGTFRKNTTSSVSNFNTGNLQQRAEAKIREALIMIDRAEDKIDDSNRNTSSAKSSVKEARENIIDSVIAFYVERDFDEALDKAEEALDNAEDAYDKARGSSSNNNNNGTRTSALNAIDDAEEAIDDARDEIEEADDDGDDVDDAEDLLEEAEDKIDEAQEEFDDRNYDDAEDLAEDAEELAQDAVDAID